MFAHYRVRIAVVLKLSSEKACMTIFVFMVFQVN